jgi:23S rRNA (guanine745-N1)-methyltransferase
MKRCSGGPQVLDAVVSVFAPCPAAEISRVLKPGGCLVAASPGRDHLSSIKALIYDNPQPFPSDKGVVSEADQKHCGLALVDGMQVVTELVLEGQDAQNLLTMTPYFWRASKEVQQQIASLPQLRTTVDITVTRYQRLS